MPTALHNIRLTLGQTAEGRAPRWHEVRLELLAATSVRLEPEVERLLLEVLRHEGDLRLDEAAEMPHRMSPESMLKSLAVQALGRWTGTTYMPTLRRLLNTAPPPLATTIRGVIQKVLTAPQPHEVAVVEMPVVNGQPSEQPTAVPVRRVYGMALLSGEHRPRGRRQAEPAQT